MGYTDSELGLESTKLVFFHLIFMVLWLLVLLIPMGLLISSVSMWNGVAIYLGTAFVLGLITNIFFQRWSDNERAKIQTEVSDEN